MTSGPTYVRITADVTDLTAKLAIAKAEFANTNSDLRSMAKQMTEAGAAASGEMRAGLQVAAEATAKARTEVASLNRELRETSGAASGGLKDIVSFGESGVHFKLREIAEAFSGIGIAMAAVFAAKEIFEGIERTAELGANLLKLSEQTGIAVEALSGLHYAAEQEDVSAESLDVSIKRLGKSIQEALKNPASTAAQAFVAMGISQDYLRENSNDLLAIFLKMADAFHDHADGARADAIAMAALGRGGVEVIPVLRNGREEIEKQIEKQKELGSQMTGPMSEAMKEHLQAVKDMKEAWHGLWLAISTKPIEFFTYVAAGFEHMALAVAHAADGFKALAAAVNLLSGSPIPAAPKDYGAEAAPGGHAYKMKPGESPEFSNLAKPDKAAKDFYAKWKEQLDQTLLAQQLFGREAQAYELEFWQTKLAIAQAGGKNYVGAERQITSTIYQLESEQHRQALEDERKAVQEKKRLQDESYRAFKARIDAEREAASGNFAEQIRLDQQLVHRAKVLYGQDSANFQEALRKKTADMKAEVDKQLEPYKRLTTTVGNSFDQMFRGMLEGTQNFSQAMLRLTASLIEDFAKMAFQSVETWTVAQIRNTLVSEQAEARKTAASVIGSQTRTAAGVTENAGFFGRVAAQIASWFGLEAGKTAETTAGAATRSAETLAETFATITAAKAMALAEIPAYTGIAAIGAASSVAPIPFIGPELAVAAFAEMQGLGAGALAMASAAGGMDIGAGVNPITQLHEKEMVLPASLSERVRNMTDSGGVAGSGDTHVHLNLNAIDGPSAQKFLENNAGTIVKSIAKQIRNGHPAFKNAMSPA